MSDIFDAYAKTAIEKGWISPLDKLAEETNPRHSSETIKDIENKYNLKIKLNEKDENPMEQAHSESMYYSPAYDELNGLVENEMERQNVSTYIALKPSHGKLTNERYIKAHQDLVNELTKIAFHLDKKNKVELMNLADDCAGRLVKIAPAFLAALPWIIGGIAAAGTAMSARIENWIGLSEGIKSDIDDAIEQLNEVIAEEPETSSIFHSVVVLLESLKENYEKAFKKKITLNELLRGVFDKKNEKLSKNLIEKKYNSEIFQFFTEYKDYLDRVMKVLPTVLTDLQSAKERYGYTGGMFYSAYRFFVPSDFEEAAEMITRVIKGISEESKQVTSSIVEYNKLVASIDETVKEHNEKTNLDSPTENVPWTSKDIPNLDLSKSPSSADKDLEDLFKPMKS